MKIEDKYRVALIDPVNKRSIVDFLRGCGFDLLDFCVGIDGDLKIIKTPDWHSSLQDEGTGFALALRLAGILLSERDPVLREEDFRGLHPVLWNALKKEILRDSNKKECVYLAPLDVRFFLKCAVSPSSTCEDCSLFKERETRNITIVERGRSINPPISVETEKSSPQKSGERSP